MKREKQEKVEVRDKAVATCGKEIKGTSSLRRIAVERQRRDGKDEGGKGTLN